MYSLQVVFNDLLTLLALLSRDIKNRTRRPGKFNRDVRGAHEAHGEGVAPDSIIRAQFPIFISDGHHTPIFQGYIFASTGQDSREKIQKSPWISPAPAGWNAMGMETIYLAFDDFFILARAEALEQTDSKPRRNNEWLSCSG